MKFKGLNGREYSVQTNKYIVRPDNNRGRSQYHLRARDLLKDMFRSYTILEEMKLPGVTKIGGSLYLDFYIPNLDLAFEVHGRQHYEFVPFFHKTKAGFMQAQRRDVLKGEWCEVNNIQLIELSYERTDDEWREQIAGR